ncbi:hypothetical protein MKX03_027304, partial [Papaver bracteatum]
MESSLPNEQVKNTEKTHSSNPLSMKPHDQHSGEIKDTHLQENGKASTNYKITEENDDLHKVEENGHNSVDNEMFVQEICGDELKHKDGEREENGLVLADSKEPFDFHSQLELVPGIKQIYLKKLEHIQAIELLKCICAKISLLSNNDILQFFLNSNILNTAAKFGIVEIVIECIQTFPDQIWFIFDGRSIFHIAVEHRKEKIFNLMYGMSAQKKILASWRVESNNNILHLAAKLAPSSQLHTVSGADHLMLH